MGLVMSFMSCTGCNSSKEDIKLQDSAVAALDVEHLIALDRQTMYVNYKDVLHHLL